MKKIVFILCMSLAVTMCASPCMAKQKKVTYKYKASNKTLTVSGKHLRGKGPIGIFDAYYMPTKYEYKWSSLSGKVKKVVLKKGVERIGYNAFGDFGKLKSVKFPKTLKRIDDYAFCATPIPNVSLPDRVKYIGKSAFDMDGEKGGIVKLKLPRKLKSIGESAFRMNKIKEVVIPADVENIGADAFQECTSLKKIVIKSKKIKNIGSGAFADIVTDAVFYVPKEREEDYRKILLGRGVSTPEETQIIAQ